MNILAGLCVLLFVLAALLIIVGATGLGGRLLFAALALAVIGPFLGCVLHQTEVSASVPSAIWLIVLLLLVLVAYVKFTNRKRAFKEWFVKEEKLSLKSRKEKD